MPSLADHAPDFSLLGADGAVHTLEEYADAAALVLVQACNHCPFVQSWEDRLDAVAREYKPRGVEVVLINSNDAAQQPEDGFSEMAHRAQERRIAYDYLHDADQSLARALGAQRTPEVFVFDTDRRLAYHGAVDDNRDDQAVSVTYLRDALDAVLEGRPVTVPRSEVVGCTVKWRG
jgi:peroxiredoxin